LCAFVTLNKRLLTYLLTYLCRAYWICYLLVGNLSNIVVVVVVRIY